MSFQSSRFPLNVEMWSPFASDCLWASSWHTKDYEEFERMATNKSFPRTQDFWYNLIQAAKLIRMKVHLFSYSTLCVGVSNPDPSNTRANKLEDVWKEQWFVENLNLAARALTFIWHVLPVASTRQSRILFGITWMDKNPEYSDEKSFSCPRSTTLNGQKKATPKLVCMMTKKWQHLRPNSSQDTGVSWSPRQKKRGGTQMPTNSPRIMGCGRIADGWHIQVSHSPPNISCDRAIIVSTVKARRNTFPFPFPFPFQFPKYFRQQEASHRLLCFQSDFPLVWDRKIRYQRLFWQAIFGVFTIEFASGRHRKKGTFTDNSGRRRTNRSQTRAVDIDYSKTANSATHSKRLGATHRESRGADPESVRTKAAYARTVENGHLNITNESVMDGNSSTLLCRKYS